MSNMERMRIITAFICIILLIVASKANFESSELGNESNNLLPQVSKALIARDILNGNFLPRIGKTFITKKSNFKSDMKTKLLLILKAQRENEDLKKRLADMERRNAKLEELLKNKENEMLEKEESHGRHIKVLKDKVAEMSQHVIDVTEKLELEKIEKTNIMLIAKTCDLTLQQKQFELKSCRENEEILGQQVSQLIKNNTNALLENKEIKIKKLEMDLDKCNEKLYKVEIETVQDKKRAELCEGLLKTTEEKYIEETMRCKKLEENHILEMYDLNITISKQIKLNKYLSTNLEIVMTQKLQIEQQLKSLEKEQKEESAACEHIKNRLNFKLTELIQQNEKLSIKFENEMKMCNERLQNFAKCEEEKLSSEKMQITINELNEKIRILNQKLTEEHKEKITWQLRSSQCDLELKAIEEQYIEEKSHCKKLEENCILEINNLNVTIKDHLITNKNMLTTLENLTKENQQCLLKLSNQENEQQIERTTCEEVKKKNLDEINKQHITITELIEKNFEIISKGCGLTEEITACEDIKIKLNISIFELIQKTEQLSIKLEYETKIGTEYLHNLEKCEEEKKNSDIQQNTMNELKKSITTLTQKLNDEEKEKKIWQLRAKQCDLELKTIEEEYIEEKAHCKLMEENNILEINNLNITIEELIRNNKNLATTVETSKKYIKKCEHQLNVQESNQNEDRAACEKIQNMQNIAIIELKTKNEELSIKLEYEKRIGTEHLQNLEKCEADTKKSDILQNTINELNENIIIITEKLDDAQKEKITWQLRAGQCENELKEVENEFIEEKERCKKLEKNYVLEINTLNITINAHIRNTENLAKKLDNLTKENQQCQNQLTSQETQHREEKEACHEIQNRLNISIIELKQKNEELSIKFEYETKICTEHRQNLEKCDAESRNSDILQLTINELNDNIIIITQKLNDAQKEKITWQLRAGQCEKELKEAENEFIEEKERCKKLEDNYAVQINTLNITINEQIRTNKNLTTTLEYVTNENQVCKNQLTAQENDQNEERAACEETKKKNLEEINSLHITITELIERIFELNSNRNNHTNQMEACDEIKNRLNISIIELIQKTEELSIKLEYETRIGSEHFQNLQKCEAEGKNSDNLQNTINELNENIIIITQKLNDEQNEKIRWQLRAGQCESELEEVENEYIVEKERCKKLEENYVLEINRLNVTINEQIRNNENLVKKLNNFTTEILQCENQLTSQEVQRREEKDTCHETQNRLNISIIELIQKTEELSTKIEYETKIVTEYRQNLEKCEAERKNSDILQITVNELTENIIIFTQKLNDEQNEKIRWQLRAGQCENELKEVENEFIEEKARCKKLEENYVLEINTLNVTINEQIRNNENLTTTLEYVTNENQVCKTQLTAQENDQNDERAACEEAKKQNLEEINGLHITITELIERIFELNSNRNNHTDQMEACDEIKNRLNISIIELIQKTEELSLKLEYETRIGSEHFQNLQKCEAERKNSDMLQIKVNELNENILIITQKLNNEQNEKMTWQLRARQCENELKEVENEFIEEKTRCKKLEENYVLQINSLNITINEQIRNSENLFKKLNNFTIEIQQCENQLISQETQYKEEKAACHETQNRLNISIIELIQKNEELSIKLEYETKIGTEHRQNLEKCEAEKTNSDILQITINELNENIIIFTQKLNDEQNEKIRWQLRAGQCENELKEVENEFIEEKARCKKLEENCALEINTLNLKINEQIRTNQNLTTTLEYVTNKNQVCKNQLTTQENDQNEERAACEEAKKQNLEEINGLHITITELIERIFELNSNRNNHTDQMEACDEIKNRLNISIIELIQKTEQLSIKLEYETKIGSEHFQNLQKCEAEGKNSDNLQNTINELNENIIIITQKLNDEQNEKIRWQLRAGQCENELKEVENEFIVEKERCKKLEENYILEINNLNITINEQIKNTENLSKELNNFTKEIQQCEKKLSSQEIQRREEKDTCHETQNRLNISIIELIQKTEELSTKIEYETKIVAEYRQNLEKCEAEKQNSDFLQITINELNENIIIFTQKLNDAQKEKITWQLRAGQCENELKEVENEFIEEKTRCKKLEENYVIEINTLNITINEQIKNNENLTTTLEYVTNDNQVCKNQLTIQENDQNEERAACEEAKMKNLEEINGLHITITELIERIFELNSNRHNHTDQMEACDEIKNRLNISIIELIQKTEQLSIKLEYETRIGSEHFQNLQKCEAERKNSDMLQIKVNELNENIIIITQKLNNEQNEKIRWQLRAGQCENELKEVENEFIEEKGRCKKLEEKYVLEINALNITINEQIRSNENLTTTLEYVTNKHQVCKDRLSSQENAQREERATCEEIKNNNKQQINTLQSTITELIQKNEEIFIKFESEKNISEVHFKNLAKCEDEKNKISENMKNIIIEFNETISITTQKVNEAQKEIITWQLRAGQCDQELKAIEDEFTEEKVSCKKLEENCVLEVHNLNIMMNEILRSKENIAGKLENVTRDIQQCEEKLLSQHNDHMKEIVAFEEFKNNNQNEINQLHFTINGLIQKNEELSIKFENEKIIGKDHLENLAKCEEKKKKISENLQNVIIEFNENVSTITQKLNIAQKEKITWQLRAGQCENELKDVEDEFIKEKARCNKLEESYVLEINSFNITVNEQIKNIEDLVKKMDNLSNEIQQCEKQLASQENKLTEEKASCHEIQHRLNISIIELLHKNEELSIKLEYETNISTELRQNLAKCEAEKKNSDMLQNTINELNENIIIFTQKLNVVQKEKITWQLRAGQCETELKEVEDEFIEEKARCNKLEENYILEINTLNITINERIRTNQNLTSTLEYVTNENQVCKNQLTAQENDQNEERAACEEAKKQNLEEINSLHITITELIERIFELNSNRNNHTDQMEACDEIKNRLNISIIELIQKTEELSIKLEYETKIGYEHFQNLQKCEAEGKNSDNLQNTINELNENIIIITQKLNDEQNEKIRWQLRAGQCESELKEVENEFIVEKTRCKKLEENYVLEINNLNITINEQIKNTENLAKELNNFTKEIQQCENQLTSQENQHREEIAACHETQNRLNISIIELIRKTEELFIKLEYETKISTEHRQNLEKCEAEKKNSDILQITVNELNDNIIIITQKLNDAQKEKITWQLRAGQCENELKEVENEFIEEKARCKKLEENYVLEINTLNITINENIRNNQNLTTTLEYVTNENQVCKNQLTIQETDQNEERAACEETKNKNLEEINNLHIKITELIERIFELNSNRNNHTDQMEACDEIKNRLNISIIELIQKTEELSIKLEYETRIGSEHFQNLQKCEIERKNSNMLQNTINELNENIIIITQKLNDEESEKIRWQLRAGQCENQLKVVEKEFLEEKELCKKREENYTLEKNNLDVTIIELQTHNKNLAEKLQNVTKENSQCEQQLISQVNYFNEERAACEENKNSLNTKITELILTNARLEEQRKMYVEQLQSLANCEANRKNCENLQSLVNELNYNIKIVTEKLNSARTENVKNQLRAAQCEENLQKKEEEIIEDRTRCKEIRENLINECREQIKQQKNNTDIISEKYKKCAKNLNDQHVLTILLKLLKYKYELVLKYKFLAQKSTNLISKQRYINQFERELDDYEQMITAFDKRRNVVRNKVDDAGLKLIENLKKELRNFKIEDQGL